MAERAQEPSADDASAGSLAPLNPPGAATLMEPSLKQQARSILRAQDALVAGVFLAMWWVLAFFGRQKLFRDPGVYWHMVLGELTLSSGHVVNVDPFSFTPPGRSWLDTHWLAGIFLALTHRIGGFDGLLQLTCLLMAFLVSLIYYRFLREGVHPLLAFLMLVAGVGVVSTHIHPRPHLATMILQGLIWMLAVDLESGRKQRDHFWLLPLVFIVWTNLHGGVIGGIATFTLCALGWLLYGIWKWPSPVETVKNGWCLGLCVLACWLALLVNPFGMRWFEPWLAVVGSPVIPRLINEHGPLTAFPFQMGIVVGFAMIYLAALVGVLPGRPRVTWLVPLAWLPLAFLRVRHGPLFAITALVSLADMLPHVRSMRWLANAGSMVCRIVPPPAGTDLSGAFRILFPLACSLACAFWLRYGVQTPIVGRGWAMLDPASAPVGLLPELRKLQYNKSSGTPIFNETDLGGFLIYFTPGYRVFVDDRCELYGDAGMLEYARAEASDPGRLESWRNRYPFELALVVRGSHFDLYLENSNTWHLIGSDPTGKLYEHKPFPQPPKTKQVSSKNTALEN